MREIAIFVSGSGTNCENIIRHFQNSDIAHVALVVSNREDAYALVRAKRFNIPSVVINKSQLNDSSYMIPLLEKYRIDFIVLAGFLLMVPPYLINHFSSIKNQPSIINLHPALLPKYGGMGMYGHHVHEAVKTAGETVSGITIHYVSEICDNGDIIAQFHTPLSPDDTPDAIASKIHILEQTYFPMVIEGVLKTNRG